MAAERQMMGSSPSFYSPLHSMAWAGAFGAAAGAGAGAGAGASSPGPKSGYSFGYPPTPPKESPGTSGTPASLQGDPAAYHEESQQAGAGLGVGEDITSERVDIKPSADHLMLNMAGGGGAYPVPGARTHKCQDGEWIFPPDWSFVLLRLIISRLRPANHHLPSRGVRPVTFLILALSHSLIKDKIPW